VLKLVRNAKVYVVLEKIQVKSRLVAGGVSIWNRRSIKRKLIYLPQAKPIMLF